MSSKLLRQQLKQVLKSEGKTEASLRPEKKLSKKAARKAKKIQQDLNEDKQDKSTYEKNLEYYKQGLLTTLASEKAAAAMQAIVTRRDPQYAPKDLLYPDTDSKSD